MASHEGKKNDINNKLLGTSPSTHSVKLMYTIKYLTFKEKKKKGINYISYIAISRSYVTLLLITSNVCVELVVD